MSLHVHKLLTNLRDEGHSDLFAEVIRSHKFAFDPIAHESILIDAEDHATRLLSKCALRLPYDNCLFEFQHDSTLVWVLAQQEPMTTDHKRQIVTFRIGADDNGKCGLSPVVAMLCDAERAGQFRIIGAGMSADIDYSIKKINEISSNYEHMKVISHCCGLLKAIIGLLSTAAGVSTKQVLADEVINQRRAAKGKVPCDFTYKILKIDPLQLQIPRRDGNGTHASPALHLRRGHWHTYANGLKWLEPFWVGDPNRGTVHKDYSVKAAGAYKRGTALVVPPHIDVGVSK